MTPPSFRTLRIVSTGEAYDLVKGLRLVDGSYEIALRLLRQRFEDPKMILRELLDGLFAVS